jgi:hypothetical protein
VPILRERPYSVSQIRQWAARGRLFAILDATDTPAVPAKARQVGEGRAVSLYRGRAEEELWSIAPFLVQVDEEVLDWMTEVLWPEPWGIFVLADEPLDALRGHFRRFLVVESPEGESWYFRFYDPRVLARYLPACTESELEDFFGPVKGLGMTDPASYGIRVWTLSAAPAGTATTRSIMIRRA